MMTNIDILVLGDENSTIASELGAMKTLGEQYVMATVHRPCSSVDAVGGFDLIILDSCYEENALDVHRVKTNTLEMCRRLRQNTDALILLVSSIDDEEYATEAYEADVDEFIVKPIILPLLRAKLQAWLRWRTPDPADDLKMH